MSDENRKQSALTGRGEPPLSSPDEAAKPPGEVVSGRVVVRGDVAELRAQVGVEVSQQLAQLKLELLGALRPLPTAPQPTLREVCATWLAKVTPTRVIASGDAHHVAHLEPLAHLTEVELTVAAVEDLLASLRLPPRSLSPNTVNKVRSAGRLAVDLAQAQRLWGAINPFKLVRRHKEAQRTYELLTLDELARVQAKLRPDRRRLFRVQLHLGLRTGEVFALQARDVDLVNRVVTIRRSHGRDTTKTGRTRTVPLLPAVAGDLLEAIDANPAGPPERLLFPSGDGALQRYDTKLTRVLRTAMAAAGVGLVSVTYKCRARECSEWLIDEATPVRVQRKTCKCNATLWPVPRVRDVRWYDLRHMCATFHHQAGADPLCVALALGHSIKGTTQAIYTHPSNTTMMTELSRWKLQG